MVCLAEMSALSQVKGRAVARREGEACALAERWCLTVCLRSDRSGIALCLGVGWGVEGGGQV